MISSRRHRRPARPHLVHPARPRGHGEGGGPVTTLGAVTDYPIILEGKVRQVREVDADRLLLVATDRISAYDWIMPTPIPDKGRILTAMSAFWFGRHRRHRPEPPDRAGGRAGDAREAPADAADRVRRARLPGGLGLEGLPGDRRGLRPPPAPRSAAGRPAAAADLHAGDQGHRGPRHEHQPRRGGGDRGRRRAGRGRADHPRPLRARLRALRGGRDDPGRHQVRARLRRATAG